MHQILAAWAIPEELFAQALADHRREVRDAILDATAALVDEKGLLAVTMSEIAERTGIGRATLYKYFHDVEAVLLAWHERAVSAHLAQLARTRDDAGDAGDRLEAVLTAFALITHQTHGHHESELSVFFTGTALPPKRSGASLLWSKRSWRTRLPLAWPAPTSQRPSSPRVASTPSTPPPL